MSTLIRKWHFGGIFIGKQISLCMKSLSMHRMFINSRVLANGECSLLFSASHICFINRPVTRSESLRRKPQSCLSFLQPITLFYEAEFSLTLAMCYVLKFTRRCLASWAKRGPLFFSNVSRFGGLQDRKLPCLCSSSIPCCYLWLCCYGRKYFFVLT